MFLSCTRDQQPARWVIYAHFLELIAMDVITDPEELESISGIQLVWICIYVNMGSKYLIMHT